MKTGNKKERDSKKMRNRERIIKEVYSDLSGVPLEKLPDNIFGSKLAADQRGREETTEEIYERFKYLDARYKKLANS